MYPLSLNIVGRLCTVVGGGSVAARKVQGLLKAGARVRLISPELVPDLQDCVAKGLVEWQPRCYKSGDLQGALLAFAATDNSAVQEEVRNEAEQEDVLLNVADEPEKCDFQVPAILRRGDLSLAVSTEGRSPAVAAMVRQQLEDMIGPEYEALLLLCSLIRSQLPRTESTPWQRKVLFQKLLHPDILQWIKNGQSQQLSDHVHALFGPEVMVNLEDLRLE